MLGCLKQPIALLTVLLITLAILVRVGPQGPSALHDVMHPALAFNIRPAADAPYGLSPVALRHAYGLPDTLSTPQLVAVVDAGNAPTLESDLQVYDAQYGLPACTTANGCLTIVDQNGGQNLPANDASWAVEESLDVQTVHGICPDCRILLVEANGATDGDLTPAVDTAARLGANEISLSWGGPQFKGAPAAHYRIPGVAVLAASGDDGYGAEYPASVRGVVSVGGTTLHINGDGSYGSESVWSGTGSGCTAFSAAELWETGRPYYRHTGCDGHKALNTIAADANPVTGISVYDSTPDEEGGTTYVDWYEVGGTSLATPIWAATIALAGGVPAGMTATQWLYSGAWKFHDILAGKNGSCGLFPRMCTAHKGWDGGSGLGTPKGVGGFVSRKF